VVIVSAAGFSFIFEKIKNRLLQWVIFAFLFILSIDPMRYMAANRNFFYIYFNQLAGGLKGASGKYETDYYYTGQTEASKWLIDYLEKNKIDSTEVMATFPVDWQFRKMPRVRTFYCRNEERSQADWDYAIVSSRYVEPSRLKDGSWPPSNAIHIVYADSIPVCAVLRRQTKDDYTGYIALEEGRSSVAVKSFTEALKINGSDEMIFYNFARSLRDAGDFHKADSVLAQGLVVNPECEPIMMYLGKISIAEKDSAKAEMYFDKLIKVNRKYFEAYIDLARIEKSKDMQKARELLRSCLLVNPHYIPAIKALADTYRKSNPDIAEKYDKLVDKLNIINN
jgi:hypothetical protein